MPAGDGGLGAALVGEKVSVGARTLSVTKLLGEGGFSYVYLVKETADGMGAGFSDGSGPESKDDNKKVPLVLKVTSIHSRAQRDIAEKEAKLLSRLSHPSIIKMYDTCYRTSGSSSQGKKANAPKERPQHLILMEFCEGGHALDVCNQLAAQNQRFDLPTLIIAFGQICNAVSYLHAQRPPIVHRDLKPVNFLVKNGAYKLCDFGSAVFGHVDLRTPKARAEAEEVIQKTTTQMFRAPEMVDLYMAKKLTQATDVWALGCCLYSMAFLQNCFEEGSNLAILSGKYTIPEDNPYGDGLVELLDRMLTSDSKARSDMTDVILCLSAVYSGRPLPPRKKPSRSSKTDGQDGSSTKKDEVKDEKSRIGSYRTDGQGFQQPVYDPTKATEGKKLASNSVAARRKRAAASATKPSTSAAAAAPSSAPADPMGDFSAFGNDDKDGAAAFGKDIGFGEMKGFETKGEGNDTDFFGSFDKATISSRKDSNDGFDAFDTGAWGSSAGGQLEPDDALDGDRKAKAKSRREGTNSRSSRGVEAGIETLNISDSGGNRVRNPKAEDLERRNRRKARPSRGDRVDDEGRALDP